MNFVNWIVSLFTPATKPSFIDGYLHAEAELVKGATPEELFKANDFKNQYSAGVQRAIGDHMSSKGAVK